MTKIPAPILWKDNSLYLLDQRLLPLKEEYLKCDTIEAAFHGIRDMVVRGAPCIGFTAIYGLALWLGKQSKFDPREFQKTCEYLKEARPTAVNLMFEIDRVLGLVSERFKSDSSIRDVFEFVVRDGNTQIDESLRKNTAMAEFALQDLVKRYPGRKLRLMTHCNTGFLACGTLGTALGVISHCHSKNLVEMVYADETRPYLQGSRLTAYELSKDEIPHKIVVEGAASYLMRNKLVDAIFVGADRIAANGDTANKVGTSTLAIVANHYGVPFYVVAPMSTFDFNTSSGSDIHIEMRDDREITHYKDLQIAPSASTTLNPSFDVTDAKLIAGIISEKGLVLNPSIETMKFFQRAK